MHINVSVYLCMVFNLNKSGEMIYCASLEFEKCLKPIVQSYSSHLRASHALWAREARAHAPVPALSGLKAPPCLHFDPQGTCV